jgi:tetratricopeptide (TPR) repeat protein
MIKSRISIEILVFSLFVCACSEHILLKMSFIEWAYDLLIQNEPDWIESHFQVNEAKEKGNEEFKAQRYEEAAKWFTEGLKLDPNNYVLLSNRSACYVKIGKLKEALEDANKVIALKPDWARVSHSSFLPLPLPIFLSHSLPLSLTHPHTLSLYSYSFIQNE